MATPASRWRPSDRRYQPTAAWEYAEGAQLQRLRAWGQVRVGGHEYTVSGALAGQYVQLVPLGTDRMLVFYRRTCVRELNLRKKQSYAVYFSREQNVFEE